VSNNNEVEAKIRTTDLTEQQEYAVRRSLDLPISPEMSQKFSTLGEVFFKRAAWLGLSKLGKLDT